MCFSIPLEVLRVKGNQVTVEGERVARFDKELRLGKGDFVQVTGAVVISKLKKTDGLRIRRLIKRLNS